MGVPGEDLAGVYSAKDFVGWYNGLPSCREVCRADPVKGPDRVDRGTCSDFIVLIAPPAQSGPELRNSRHPGTRQRGLGCSSNTAVSFRYFKGEKDIFNLFFFSLKKK